MKVIFFFLIGMILPASAFAKTAEYEINIDYQTVNYTGKNVQAMTIGGTIPGKTIEASEGDTLRVTFHNKMDVETSIHWHGIILPNDQDGVPYLTTLPIRAGKSLTYEYPVVQSGTYWYHSHTGLQEQRGVYGALIFHAKERRYDYDKEYVVALSDWTDEDPDQVLRHLKMDGDYYSVKKNSVQSWTKVLQHGWKAVWIRLKSAWIRMGPMDITDVGYDAFLMNGKSTAQIGPATPGEKILLRIINMSASTHFDIEFAASRGMHVIAVDGMNVEKSHAGRFRIAIAETYDVLVSVPENKAYELRATAMDGSGYASGFLGEGEKVFASDIPRPNLFLMDHTKHGIGHAGHDTAGHDHAAMQHGNGPHILTYEDLKSVKVTTLPDGPLREMTLRLTGNMERYKWSFNDKTLDEADAILIRKGDRVRIYLVNETMMDHPIHLHGHFFRVLNKQGEFSPLKHTVDIKAFETRTIEFLADQEKDWLFHCHILYHMMAGMSRIFSYENSSPYPPAIAAMRQHKRVHQDHSHWYAWGDISAQSNLVDGFTKMTDDKNQFEIEWDNNYTGEYDVKPKYLRNVSRFLDLYAGGEFERKEDHDAENLATWGFRYMLPMLIEMEYKMDHRGGQEIGLHAGLQLTDRLEAHGFYEFGFDFERPWNYSEFETEHEYRVELEYRVTKNFSVVGNYDSDHRGGGGIRLRF